MTPARGRLRRGRRRPHRPRLPPGVVRADRCRTASATSAPQRSCGCPSRRSSWSPWCSCCRLARRGSRRSWSGLLLGLLTVVKVLDMGFYASLDRPFDRVIDWRYLGSAVGLLHDSFGRAGGDLMLVVAGLVLVGAARRSCRSPLLRLTRVVARHRAASQRAVVALTVLWLALRRGRRPRCGRCAGSRRPTPRRRLRPGQPGPGRARATSGSSRGPPPGTRCATCPPTGC